MMAVESPSNRHDFSGRIALVAGASRGIGAVTARAFARAGARVVVAARDPQALEGLVHDIRSAGGEALAIPTDVGDAAAAERLVDETMSAFGRLDAAFNNATDGPLPALLADIDPAVERATRGAIAPSSTSEELRRLRAVP